jgi:hypothetical protein
MAYHRAAMDGLAVVRAADLSAMPHGITPKLPDDINSANLATKRIADNDAHVCEFLPCAG